MLDINSLRLTDEEDADRGFQALADAATSKALWGVQEWLEDEAKTREKAYLAVGGLRSLITSLETMASNLQDQLLAAGMTRPEGE